MRRIDSVGSFLVGRLSRVDRPHMRVDANSEHMCLMMGIPARAIRLAATGARVDALQILE